MSYDVIVLGLGAIGSSTSYQLACQGTRVLGLEQYGPIHDRGASHGETRCIFQAYFVGPRYVSLARSAYRLWGEISERADVELLVRTGALLLSSEPGTMAARAQAVALAAGLDHELLDAGQLRKRYPELTPSDETAALHDPSGGFLRVEQSVRAYLDLAERAGATLQFEERVLSWKATERGVTVTTDRSRYHAGHLVFCVGSWIERFLPEVPVQIIRKAQVWLEPSTDLVRFRPERFPVWCWDTGAAIALGFPILAPGRGAKVALHTGGRRCDPDQVDREVRPTDVNDVTEFLRPRLPALAGGRYVRGEIGLYDISPDRHFIVGRVPGRDRVYLAAGTSGHAFKFSPVLGKALADLTLHGQTEFDIGAFDPARLAAFTACSAQPGTVSSDSKPPNVAR